MIPGAFSLLSMHMLMNRVGQLCSVVPLRRDKPLVAINHVGKYCGSTTVSVSGQRSSLTFSRRRRHHDHSTAAIIGASVAAAVAALLAGVMCCITCMFLVAAAAACTPCSYTRFPNAFHLERPLQTCNRLHARGHVIVCLPGAILALYWRRKRRRTARAVKARTDAEDGQTSKETHSSANSFHSDLPPMTLRDSYGAHATPAMKTT